MPKPFSELRERLLQAGVAPRHVRRYLRELGDHLDDLFGEEKCAGRTPPDAESAALIRLGTVDELAHSMLSQLRFRSWCVRAPWAMFTLVPLVLLAAAYLVACLILWSGWQIFLPESDTPFVGLIDGWAIFYFGLGRLLYFSAPVVVGWLMCTVAIRQRLKSLWPAAGLIAVAWTGGFAQVQASRSAIPTALGHISMNFSGGSSVQSISSSLFHALSIFSLAILPWLLWRAQKSSSVSD